MAKTPYCCFAVSARPINDPDNPLKFMESDSNVCGNWTYLANVPMDVLNAALTSEGAREGMGIGIKSITLPDGSSVNYTDVLGFIPIIKAEDKTEKLYNNKLMPTYNVEFVTGQKLPNGGYARGKDLMFFTPKFPGACYQRTITLDPHLNANGFDFCVLKPVKHNGKIFPQLFYIRIAISCYQGERDNTIEGINNPLFRKCDIDDLYAAGTITSLERAKIYMNREDIQAALGSYVSANNQNQRSY